MKSIVVLCYLCCIFGTSLVASTPVESLLPGLQSFLPMQMDPLKLNPVNQTWCTCGVFLTGQFKKGETPKGNPALMHEQDSKYPCTPMGAKQCSNKCLETIAKHLPNSPTILCGSIDRDVVRERAYLFIQGCDGKWINTNLSAGREFCCKDGSPYKCANNLI